MFLKFIGPIQSLFRGNDRFHIGKIYQVNNPEKAEELKALKWFEEVSDPRRTAEAAEPVLTPPSAPKEDEVKKTGGVKITAAPKEVGDATQDEGRGDIGADFVKTGVPPLQPVEAVKEIVSEEDSRPRLPASAFTSKKAAIAWAKEHLGEDLDVNRALGTLNNDIATAYGRKFNRGTVEDDNDDDTRDENTKVEAVIVV